MLNEGQIKVTVIDNLFRLGMLEGAVLVNEMVVGDWSRRADLAVVNGKLHAFEIKSDLDTLNRLEGQIGTYLLRFDKVTVVTTQKHLTRIKGMTPDNVEIWVISDTEGATGIRVVRRGQTKEVTNMRILCGFLLKTELAAFLRQQGQKIGADTYRETLIDLVEKFPVSRLRAYLLSAIKVRYRSTHSSFLKVRGEKTELNDLCYLSKGKQSIIRNQVLLDSDGKKKEPNSNARRFDLDRLEAQFGKLPKSMPRHVLLRTS